MKKQHFLHILKKYRQGKATEEEQRFLEAYYDLFESESGMEDLNEEEKERLKQGIKNDIQEQIVKKELRTAKVRKIHSLRKIAAVLLFLLVSGAVFYLFHTKNSTFEPSVAENNGTQQEEIHPGGNKAILTLANGQKIVLDSSSQKTFSSQSYINMSRDSGILVYTSAQKETKQTRYNTITTPYGGKYKVVLSDGTKVWLNAGSSLHYPIAFNGNKRKVTLTGEGYFEVAQNKNKPFVVKAEGLQVKVLGTHFNINAYPENKEVKTTLAEGSVLVSKGKDSKQLSPGEQAGWNRDNRRFSVSKVNVREMLAWKNDLFYFDNTNIKSIMQQLARWYNVQVRYNMKEVDKKNFSGVMSRYTDIKEILKRMELTGTIHFEVEGKKVIVEGTH